MANSQEGKKTTSGKKCLKPLYAEDHHKSTAAVKKRATPIFEGEILGVPDKKKRAQKGNFTALGNEMGRKRDESITLKEKKALA